MKEICYGRDDILQAAENIAAEIGNPDIAEELCEKMAKAASDFVEHLEQGGTFHYTNY